MVIFPAIDILGGKAVRLYKGDYNKVSVFGDDPAEVARVFQAQGAGYIHIVDLDGARNGETSNFDTVCRICHCTSLFAEIGGGIRNLDTVEKYLSAGVSRVIIGTSAVKDPDFLKAAVINFPDRIAVGADVRNGFISVGGWMEDTALKLLDFARRMQDSGVNNIICTDISKDGTMNGTNLEMYRNLTSSLKMDITASGGISSLEEIRKLRSLGLYGAIVGKALYNQSLSIPDLLAAASGEERL